MIPAAFPGLPVAMFPGLLLPSALWPGAGAVDVTAAVAVIAWAFGGLIALHIATRLSRRADDDSTKVDQTPTSTGPRDGFRDAA